MKRLLLLWLALSSSTAFAQLSEKTIRDALPGTWEAAGYYTQSDNYKKLHQSTTEQTKAFTAEGKCIVTISVGTYSHSKETEYELKGDFLRVNDFKGNIISINEQELMWEVRGSRYKYVKVD